MRSAHQPSWSRERESEMTREILLTRGMVALVDDEDFERVSRYSWRAHIGRDSKSFYAARSNKCIRMHREIIGAKYGQIVDHINGNTLDNRRHNLRFCNPSQSAMNRGISPSNTSGYKGVFRDRNGRWGAVIKIHYKQIRLGSFFVKVDAARAYDRAAKKYFGEFARLNFPN